MSINNRMISVAMATYNGAEYIIEQLDSIRRQTKSVDEVVIVDDCSKDETVSLVRAFNEKYPDLNIKLYENEENLGYKKNFKKALSLCDGEILFLCDQDDAWKENKVEVLCNIFETRPEVGLVSSAFVYLGGKEKSLYARKMKAGELVEVPVEDLIFHNISQGCAMAMTKEIRDEFLEKFTEKLPHDWVLNVIAAMKKKCYYLNEYLFYYRIHDKNTIGLSDDLTLQKKRTLEIRTHDAKQAVVVLDVIKEANEIFYLEEAKLEEMRSFAILHVENLEKKRFIGIFKQNFNKNYKKLKSFRGRIMDIIFVLNKL